MRVLQTVLQMVLQTVLQTGLHFTDGYSGRFYRRLNTTVQCKQLSDKQGRMTVHFCTVSQIRKYI